MAVLIYLLALGELFFGFSGIHARTQEYNLTSSNISLIEAAGRVRLDDSLIIQCHPTHNVLNTKSNTNSALDRLNVTQH